MCHKYKSVSLVTGYNNQCVAHTDDTFRTSVTQAKSLNNIHFVKKYSHFELSFYIFPTIAYE